MPDPEMVFWANTEDGLERVDIYLDDEMLTELKENVPCAWQGIVAFVEEDIADR